MLQTRKYMNDSPEVYVDICRQFIGFIGISVSGVSFLVIRRWFAQFLQDFKEGPQAQHSKHRMRNVPIGLSPDRFKPQVDFLEDHAFFARSDRCISGLLWV